MRTLSEPLSSGIESGNPLGSIRRWLHCMEKALVLDQGRYRPQFGFLPQLMHWWADESVWDSETRRWGESVFAQVRTRFPEFAVQLPVTKAHSPTVVPLQQDKLVQSREGLLAAIGMRRSVRHFVAPPDMLVVTRATNTALTAPSACNRQPFHFLVYTEHKEVERIRTIPYGGQFEMPAIGVLVGDYSFYSDPRDVKCPIIDSSLFAMQFMLVLAANGHGTCVINWPQNEEVERQTRRVIPLADFEFVVMAIAMGKVEAGVLLPSSKKRSVESVMRRRPLL